MTADNPNPALPPPEPRDPAGTRPPLDLLGMWVQVILIQMGIEKREQEKEQNKNPQSMKEQAR